MLARMTDAERLKTALKTATAVIAEGHLDAAEAALTALSRDPAKAVLGPETAWGEPRRLHSAYLKLAKARQDAAAVIALQHRLVPPPARLAPLFRPSAGIRAAAVAASAQPVPRRLHQVWIGGAPVPETVAAWQSAARAAGWSHQLWDEAALAPLGVAQDPVYRAMRDRGDWPGAADVARYHVLRAEGGLYLDCDWLPVGETAWAEAIPPLGLSAIAEPTPRLTGTGSPFLNNAVIAAPPSHPIFGRLLAALPAVLDAIPQGPAWWVTGPLVFTLAARAGPVTLLDTALTAPAISGPRAVADQRIAELVATGDAACLLAWKPWENA